MWTCTAEVIEWRGPAPFYYLPMGEDDSAGLKEAARGLEYWGQVAVEVSIGETTFTTALFPKGGRYLVPLRAAVREAEGIAVGDVVEATVTIARAPAAPRSRARCDAERAARQAHLQQAEADVDVVPFDAAAERAFGRVAASLRAAGREPAARAHDALIAASAPANALPLFTCNPSYDMSGTVNPPEKSTAPRPTIANPTSTM